MSRAAGGWRARVTLAAAVLVTAWPGAHAADPPVLYRPALAPSETVQPFLASVAPGADAFLDEKEAVEIEARLAELGGWLRADRARGLRLDGFLTADFRGGALGSAHPRVVRADPALTIERGEDPAAPPSLDARAFTAQWRALLDGLDAIATAEFLVTAIEVDRPTSVARTDVRYDIVGTSGKAGRAQRTGTWRMTWRRSGTAWQVATWTAEATIAARAARPLFTEVTRAALGANDSFHRQLSASFDDWAAALDSAVGRDSNGHHGVSVGDADGDGRDDLYVAQPAGLPNRLFRARGDGTFEDVTAAAGLDVLDDTAQSLFADVDDDGDQDLVLATATRPLLFVNDGKGRFTSAPDAFAFARPLQGTLTSMAMADYDRDGFLDLYLCVYSYFYGAGEDKAGTPMPYHDARNGPPAVLFRNDGHGRFRDVTAETGLDRDNDRYHFAAAWVDFDQDGWPDLFVANDFGTKNLYRNRGRQDGRVTFEDVTDKAGVRDHGAGMSAAVLDYDNDGRLDLYAGNMWSAPGRRVTASAAFLPEAAAEVRALYRRHARGNTLLRNRGGGGFDDVTEKAHVEMGRWAWSSDALDFDSDGWDDLYVVNGMLTREERPADLEGFFWRQVVARSPLQRVKGTPYDDAWRAINQMLVRGSIAAHQRNVLLRNDGAGAFDDVSGASGLDLDQDGRSFAVFDLEGDGDPDLAVMAARQTPQLRIFRNDFAARGATLAIRLTGRESNRDAIGARVVVEAGGLRRTRVVAAGSGFLSQHAREIVMGLGRAGGPAKVTVTWPSGREQSFAGVQLDQRLRLEEGGELRVEPLAPPSTPATAAAAPSSIAAARAPSDVWLYEPFPAPEVALSDLAGRPATVAALRGAPALILIYRGDDGASRAALESLTRAEPALAAAGVRAAAIAVDGRADAALSFAILNRHLFMNRQDLVLPTALLLDAQGGVVKAYRGGVDVEAVRRDAAAIEAPPVERLARAVPFAGRFYSAPGRRNYLPYGRELLDQGLEKAAVVAFERAVEASPNASTLYRLGTLLVKSGERDRARAAFERALALQPDLAEAHNDLGALLAQAGDVAAGLDRFRAALALTPEYPDALNNLGYALLLSGQDAQARAAYEKALALQPDFPEALNNLGMVLARGGDLDAAEPRLRDALARKPDYGEAANNLALVLVARGRAEDAVALLDRFLADHPQQEGAYLTLARIHASQGRRDEARAVLERLLRRNPSHVQARRILEQL